MPDDATNPTRPATSAKSDAPLVRRLARTPLRDLLRGRVTGRLDWRRRVAGATDVPPAARDLVARVVRRTRLWRSERVGVADELLAHFADGVASGESVDDLLRSFGDERAAARLIRRGKIRNRPLAWHALRWVGRAFAALMALYVGVAIYFAVGRPSPRIDYVAKLNDAAMAAAPAADRAWPIYRGVILELSDPPADGDTTRRSRRWPDDVDRYERPAAWPARLAWLRGHAAALERARQAAALPALGFELGPGGSAVDAELWPAAGDSRRAADFTAAGPTANVPLPYLNEVRGLAYALADDATAAAVDDRDAARAGRDLAAMLGLSRQVRGASPGLLINDLVAVGLYALALDRVDAVLRDAPDLLDDAALTRLAHALAGPRVAGDLIGFAGERMFFYDVVQRSYTDDGRGGGRMTAQGLRLFTTGGGGPMAALTGGPLPEADADPASRTIGLYLTGPLALLAFASRGDLVAEYDRLMDAAEANLRKPLREVDPLVGDAEVARLTASTKLTGVRYLLVSILAPSVNRAQWAAERALGRRDGVVTGIALELYRRRHGAYPKELGPLVPDLLPVVPADRVTGDPVRYRLVDGKPLVYSLGADRDDDAGRPVTVNGEPRPDDAAQWGSRPERGWPDGDWALYPRPRGEPKAEDAGE